MTINTTVGRLRLHNQRVAGAKPADLAGLVRWLGAVQAQDYPQALWALGVRTAGAVMADIEQALSDGGIVRTWPMRGTLHFVPAEDARWMLALSAPRMLARDRRNFENLKLDATTLARCEALAHDALAGGPPRTRTDLLAAFDAGGVSTAEQRGYRILWYLAQTGLICLGPMQGREQAFVLLEEWAPQARDLPRDEALAELARRYFTSHGPATVRDFAWWIGQTLGDARAGLDAARESLTAIELDGAEYWMAADLDDRVADVPVEPVLLPGYDEYILGYTERGAVLAGEHAARVIQGRNLLFAPMVVADGQVVGTWRRTLKRDRVEVAFAPFDASHDTGGWGAAADAYGAFHGLPVVASNASET